MILKKVRIQNFRSIKEETIDFTSQNCKILVGVNEAGKTNVLKALSSLQTKFSPDNIRRGSGDEVITDFNIDFYFKLSTLEKQNIADKLSTEFSDINEGYFNKVGEPPRIFNLEELLDLLTVQITETSQKQHIKDTNLDEFCFAFNVKGGKYKSENSEMSHKENRYSPNTKYFLSSHLDETFYDEIELNFENLKNKILTLIENYVKEQTKKVVFWEYNEKNILPSEIEYSTFLANPSSNLTLKSLFEIAKNEKWAEEIKTKIEQDRGHVDSFLKTHYSQKILQYFKEKWPELKIKDLKIKVDGTMLRFSFIDEGDNEFYANERSDGFKRFITFLILISGKNTTGKIDENLLLVDEPDLAIHIKGQEYLLNELLNISQCNCVVFSTHSPFMIDKSNIERHYIVKKSHEVTTLTKSTESNFTDEEVLFQALGYTIFCNIKDKNVLFEGYWDNYVYNKFKNKNQNENVGHIYMGGVKNAELVAKMIELQDKDYFVLSDSDKPAKIKRAQFLETCEGKWIEYGDIVDNIITLEDFVKNKKIKKSLQTLFKTTKYSDFSEMNFDFVNDLTYNKLEYVIKECCKYNRSFDIKVFKNDFKETLFRDIKRSDIEEFYNKIVEFILAED